MDTNVTRVRVLDFETYYDKQYSLSKITTEEYIRSPQFESIGFAYRDYDLETGRPLMQEAMWVTGDHEHQQDYLQNVLDWDGVGLVAHNALFDASILAWRFGVNPVYIYDTLSMARPRYGFTVGGSLKALAKEFGIGEKGTEVLDALGKRRTDFKPAEMHAYASYCKNDVTLTGDLFFRLLEHMPQEELDVIDMMIRMHSEPRMVLDKPMLESWLEEYKEKKAALILEAIATAARSSEKVFKKLKTMREKNEPLKKLLSSNPMFTELLKALGYEPPMKVSPTTGKQIPAFGKKDPEFMAFEDAHADDPMLQALIEARKGAKSTLLESRVQRFIDMADRGPLPIPLKYYGAHTGRASGMDKLNFQNMPRGSVLRKAIMAPEGYTLVVADSGQIEARGVAWVSGERGLLDVFASGGKVYEWMAEKIYGYEINKNDHPTERQVGKIAVLGLGYGMGANKYKDTLKAMTGVSIDEQEAKRVVDVYRRTNANIKRFWNICDDAIKVVLSGGAVNLGPSSDCPLTFMPADSELGEPARIALPNGMFLRYPNLRYDPEQQTYVFDIWKGRKKEEKKVWGGVITENIVQALSRIVVFQQMLAVEKVLRKLEAQTGKVFQTVLTVHDEIVLVVPEEFGEQVLQLALNVMKTTPAWAKGWPLDAEGDVAKRYGDAK